MGCRGDKNWWKIFGVLGVMFGLAMTVVSLFLNYKNKQYRDALIDLSDHLPERETSPRDNWRSHHAPANRVTVEERLEQNRPVEEE